MAEFAPTVSRIDSNVFLVVGWDNEDSAGLRDEHMVGHLQYVEKHCDRYLIAGPLSEPGTAPLVGSFFLVAADTADAARELVAGDPYVKNGLYRALHIHAATPAVGRLLGGVIWESAEALASAQKSTA